MQVVTLRVVVGDNKYTLETYDTTTIQITKRVQDLRSIESSQGIITKQTFRIPLTGAAIEAFGDLTDLQREANVDIRKVVEGSILVNNVERFVGSFNIIGAYYNDIKKQKELELIFKGNETNLKSVLSVVKMSTLMDGETLPYTIDEIASYYNNPSSYITTNGYTWDLIDYGQGFYGLNGSGTTRVDDSSNPLHQDDFKPSITIQHVFDLIESVLEIEITTDSEIDELMEQIIPLHNNKSNLPVLDTSELDYTGYMDRTNTTTYVVNNNTTFSGPNLMNFNRAYSFNQTVFNVSSDRFTNPALPIGTNGVFQFQFDYDFTITESGLSSSVGGRVEFFVFKNGVAIGGGLSVGFGLNPGNSFSFDGTYTFELNLVPTDYIDIQIYFTQTSSDTTYTLTYTQNAASKLSCVRSPNFTSTSNVLCGKSIDPELTVWDVVKAIILQCNGVVETTVGGFNIIPWTEWIDANSELINLNLLQEEGTSVQIEPTGVTGAKSIKFTYREGKDALNVIFTELTGQRFGELLIADTGSDFATEEQVLELPFINACPTIMSGSNIPIVKMVDKDGEIIQQKAMLIPKANYRKYQQINLQDFYGGTAYTYYLIPATLSWYDSQNGGFSEKDLNFGTTLNFFAASGYPYNTLYERFWRQYVREVYSEKARKVTITANISPTEFANLSMNEVFYLQNSKFRAIAINNYNLNRTEPVEVELVKRVTLLNSDIAPYYPYDVIDGIVQWKDSSDDSDVGDGSSEPADDIETSCNAYGFFFDDNNVSGLTGGIGIQRGQLLEQ